MTDRPTPDAEFLTACDELAKRLADEGKLMAAGFVSLRSSCIPPDASEIQIREMRMAFFAGAQHLFGSLMAVMDGDREPTKADLQRVSLIADELGAFVEELKARVSDA